IGYVDMEVMVPIGLSLDILLNPGIGLDELVVVGYSSQSRRDISGSISVVNMDEVKKIPSSNIVDQLQGQIAGVQIGTTGDPGSRSFVRVRGFSTINNNEPLYVIDGVPVINQTDLNFLNPNDIQSIQVLKDASSAAVYGARAANGVILVSTKKGKIGENKLNLEIVSGIQFPGSFPDLLNPQEQLKVDQDLRKGAGLPFNSNLYIKNGDTWVLPDYIVSGGGFMGGVLAGDPRADPSRYFLSTNPLADRSKNYLIQKVNKEGTDWYKAIFNSAPMTNYQLTTSGGSEKARYYLSANYFDHHGILINNDYKRYQVRANNEFTIKNKIRLGNQFNYSHQINNAGIGNMSGFINTLELFPVRDIKGNYGGGYGLKNEMNPVAFQERRKINNTGYLSYVFGNAYAEIDLLPNLTFKSQFGLDYHFNRSKVYEETAYENPFGTSNNNLTEIQNTEINWSHFNTLNFSKILAGFIEIQSLTGMEAATNHAQGIGSQVRGLQFANDPNFRQLSNGTDVITGGTESEHYKFSLFQSLNVKISDKYLFTGIVRRDGSSRFINNRYSTFYGVSAAWRITDEPFMKNVRKNDINDLKFRIGYGETGNNEAGDYPGYSNYSNVIVFPFGASLFSGAYFSIKGYDQSTTGNPDLKWETNALFNIGLDVTLFHHLDIIAEWYHRKTRDMIFGVEQPSTAGKVGAIQTNIGSMKNTGLDLNLKYQGKAWNKKINYSIGLTLSQYRNEVLNLDNKSNSFISSGFSYGGHLTRTEVGQPLSQFHGYIVDGLWKSEEEITKTLFADKGQAKPGRFKFRDLNKDGRINDADFTFIGNPHPDFIYGIQFNAHTKNIDFSFFLNGVFGNEIMNIEKGNYYSPFSNGNRQHDVLSESGITLPVLDESDVYSFNRSSFYVEDGSYLRVKNIQLGYTLPSSKLSWLGINHLRVY
ncbi:MAG TPA: SusC/RagA family TonB-linked outer membrane protein, partial [Cyclobacteriaceae bacterium]|nr:SusC/RagA family TonB-linked outer membrane protein [Cyclobacteriaceae bacterium]